MAKQFFSDLPDTSTPLRASRLNGLLDGEEALGNIVVDSVRSKNLFGDYVILNGWIDGTSFRVNFTLSDRLIMIKCKANTTYTISRSSNTSRFRLGEYTSIPNVTLSDQTFTIPSVSKNDNGSTITYTTSNTAKYLIIHYANVNSDSETTISNSLATIQLEEGSTATTYEPYQNLNNKNAGIGQMLYNYTYFDTPSFNKIIRTGNVIQLYFKAKINTAWTSNTDILTNLPVNILGNNYTFGAYMGDDEYLPNDNAKLIFAWTQQNGTSIRMAPQEIIANKYLYILLTYITN